MIFPITAQTHLPEICKISKSGKYVLPAGKSFTNEQPTFASSNKSIMNKQIIPDSIYQDEVVCLLADRYHTDPMSLVHSFLVQSDCQMVTVTGMQKIHLEENEMEILKDLLEYIKQTEL